MKPLLIGEAPSKNESTPHPIEGRIGRRLAAFAGLTLEAFMEHFDRVNLLHVRQDTAEHGFTFDLLAARLEAARLVPTFKKGQVMLLLGGRVAEAFKVHDEYFRQTKLGLAEAYIVPHPSGVNRWYNEPGNKAKAEAFMRKVVERTLVHV